MKKHPIDDLFARKLKDQHREPLKANWETLDKALNKAQGRKQPVAWWSAAAAAVIVLLSFTYIMLQPAEAPQDLLATNNQIQKRTPIAPSKPDAEAIHEMAPLAKIHIKPETHVVTVQPNNIHTLPKEVDEPIEALAATEAVQEDVEIPIEDIVADIIENSTMLAQKASTKPVKITIKLSGNTNGNSQQMAAKTSFNFREFIAFAKHVKEGEIGLEDLREAKQDLLKFDNKKNTNP